MRRASSAPALLLLVCSLLLVSSSARPDQGAQQDRPQGVQRGPIRPFNHTLPLFNNTKHTKPPCNGTNSSLHPINNTLRTNGTNHTHRPLRPGGARPEPQGGRGLLAFLRNVLSKAGPGGPGNAYASGEDAGRDPRGRFHGSAPHNGSHTDGPFNGTHPHNSTHSGRFNGTHPRNGTYPDGPFNSTHSRNSARHNNTLHNGTDHQRAGPVVGPQGGRNGHGRSLLSGPDSQGKGSAFDNQPAAGPGGPGNRGGSTGGRPGNDASTDGMHPGGPGGPADGARFDHPFDGTPLTAPAP